MNFKIDAMPNILFTHDIPEMKRGAIFSRCMRYRYRLWRIWDEKRPAVLFIMLNPSTATAEHDDPTTRRCMDFARRWGFGGVYIGNLFAYRSTALRPMLDVADPYGPDDNNAHVLAMHDLAGDTICAWGAYGLKRPSNALTELHPEDLAHLGLTKWGAPKHPLYLPANSKIQRSNIMQHAFIMHGLERPRYAPQL